MSLQFKIMIIAIINFWIIYKMTNYRTNKKVINIAFVLSINFIKKNGLIK